MATKEIVSKTEAKKVEKWLVEAGRADGKSGRKLLFYHNHSDGICSAVLMLRFFSGFETCVCGGPIISDGFVKELIEAGPKLVVFIDLPVDQEWKKLEKIQKAVPGLRIILIDHHIYDKNLNSKDIIHINPMFKSRAYIPAALVVYRMLQQMGKRPEPLLWVAAIGTIGDYGINDCKDFLDECRHRYPKLLGRNPLKSKFWRASEMISHATALKGNVGVRKGLEFLLRAKDFNDFVANPVLGSWEKEVEGEIERVRKNAEKGKEKHGDVMVFTIDTKLGLNSEISTYFSESYHDKIIIVRRKIGDDWKLSLRCQSGRVNVGELTKRAVSGIGSGGGHARAAGAMVNDWERFLKRFVKLANSS